MVTERIPPQPCACGCGVLIPRTPGRKTRKYRAECLVRQKALYRAQDQARKVSVYRNPSKAKRETIRNEWPDDVTPRSRPKVCHKCWNLPEERERPLCSECRLPYSPSGVNATQLPGAKMTVRRL